MIALSRSSTEFAAISVDRFRPEEMAVSFFIFILQMSAALAGQADHMPATDGTTGRYRRV